jgi:putative spermidine/putrescine transport system substrate-binding protein
MEVFRRLIIINYGLREIRTVRLSDHFQLLPFIKEITLLFRQPIQNPTMLSFFRALWIFVLVFMSAAHADNLRISTWGGAYGEVYNATVLQRFARQEHTDVDRQPAWDERTDRPVDGGPDVVELSLSQARQGCSDGKLMWLPPDTLSSLSTLSSFLPNAVQPCAIGQWAWGTVIGFMPELAGETYHQPPSLVSDFFNLQEYPGKRAIVKSPRTLAEWALAASGVPADRIYAALEQTEQVWPVIEKQLRLIENHVVWVENDNDALEHLRSGLATMAMLSTNAVLSEALTRSNAPQVLWDAAVLELSMLAVPSASDNPELAVRFLHYMTAPENTLEFSAALGFSPVNFESVRLLNRRYHHYLPTMPGNFDNAIYADVLWWRSEPAQSLVSRFAEWTVKVQSLDSLVMASPVEIATAETARPLTERLPGFIPEL